MSLVWMLWLASLTAVAKPSRSKAGPELPAPPPSLTTAVVPAAIARDTHTLPGFKGAVSELDLEALSRVKRTFTVEVDKRPLSLITSENQALMVRHLSADPRWRVAEREGVLVAYEREEHEGGFTVPLHGYRLGNDEVVRVGIRFGEWPNGAVWSTSPNVLRSTPEPGPLVLQSFLLPAAPWKGWSATALSIEGEVASLDIYEAGDGEQRPHTARALGATLAYLELLVTHASRIEANGYVHYAIPFNEPASGLPTVELSSDEPGWLQVRARINPGAAGWTWVRLLDEDLKPWQEEAVGQRTRERVGWSSKPDELFYLQSRFPLPTGEAFSGTAEVWFQGEDDEAERLLALPIRVPER